jgi:hypothetical protein
MARTIPDKIFEALCIWNDTSSRSSYSRSELIQHTNHIVRNINSKPNRCHFQITTGFRNSDGSEKWFSHSKLHAFVSKDRKEIAFWAEPNVNDNDAVKDRVIATCDAIMRQWRSQFLLVATDVPSMVDEWTKGSDGPMYVFQERDQE